MNNIMLFDPEYKGDIENVPSQTSYSAINILDDSVPTAETFEPDFNEIKDMLKGCRKQIRPNRARPLPLRK